MSKFIIKGMFEFEIESETEDQANDQVQDDLANLNNISNWEVMDSQEVTS